MNFATTQYVQSRRGEIHTYCPSTIEVLRLVHQASVKDVRRQKRTTTNDNDKDNIFMKIYTTQRKTFSSSHTQGVIFLSEI